MSSLPHSEGVASVLAAIARIDALNVEEVQLVEDIRRPRVAEARLREVREQRGQDMYDIGILLESMDCASIRNHGWEGRMGWFVAEMRRQIVADIAKSPAPVDGGT